MRGCLHLPYHLRLLSDLPSLFKGLPYLGPRPCPACLLPGTPG